MTPTLSFFIHPFLDHPSQSSNFETKVSILSSQLHCRKIQLMPEYSGLKIDAFGDILVGPRMKTHGCCERHSPRPGKQTITPRVALSGRSIILFYLYIFCILNNITIECIKRKKLTSIQQFGVRTELRTQFQITLIPTQRSSLG